MAETDRTIEFLPLVGVVRSEEDQLMFTVHCPQHGTEVLLSERRIEAIVPVTGGLELRWRCWCEHRGSTVVPRLGSTGMVGRHRPAV